MAEIKRIVWSDEKTVALFGPLDEFFPYEELFSQFPEEVWLDMSEVTRINSCGVREWVRRIINCRSYVHYTNCPAVVIDQMSMVPQFIGSHASVESFSATFVCDECADEKNVLYRVGTDIHQGQDSYEEPDEIECRNCGSSMAFAHNPHVFFSFLMGTPKAS